MKDQLLEQLFQMLKSGVDFTVGQLPDVAKQLLEYNYWANIIGIKIVISFLALFVVILLIFFLFSKLFDEFKNTCEACLFPVIITFILFTALVALCMIPCNLIDNYKIKHYPKLYLMEYLKSNLTK